MFYAVTNLENILIFNAQWKIPFVLKWPRVEVYSWAVSQGWTVLQVFIDMYEQRQYKDILYEKWIRITGAFGVKKQFGPLIEWFNNECAKYSTFNFHEPSMIYYIVKGYLDFYLCMSPYCIINDEQKIHT